MYAGTTLRRHSGKVVGVHQKIDRIARRSLTKYLSESVIFPNIKQILRFEGKNGPDAVRYMNPVVDKPWHFIDPTKPQDKTLIKIIENHTVNLTNALIANDDTRASFEAAWLAHAVVDGLTPAHHYPLHDKIEELWGKPRHEITGGKTKNIIRGVNRRDTISKNWEYWGAKGVMTAHIMFEMGIASAISADNFKHVGPSMDDIKSLSTNGFEAEFMKSLNLINDMKLYDEFGKTGWTRRLASQTKKVLIPEIIKVVALVWYQAASAAEAKLR